jgi:ABC-type branched-subunit amino acid transport system ATPase component/branched-subunit amino acid ABC-type transport system permease component
VSAYLPFIVIGITAGSVYGLTATGLVLTYKTSGIFNFGQGSLAAVAVFVFYWLNVDLGLAWPLAAALSVFVLGAVMGLALELLGRLLADASDTLKIASTVGILLTVLALGTVWYPDQPSVPSYLPTSTAFQLFGVNVAWDSVIVTVVALVGAAALYVFFRYFRLGMAMRGVVDDDDLVAMSGISPQRIRRIAWIIGSVFAAASGILLAPSLNLDAIVLTELVIQAFGAAAIGYFSSLPLTYLGGLVVGVLGALSTKFVVTVPWLIGLPPSLPFIILFIALIVTPRSKLVRRRFAPSRAFRESWHAPVRVRLGTGVVVLTFLCLVPVWVGANLPVWSSGMVDAIIFLSLGLLIRHAGQVSLCQYAFVGIGAAAMAHFTTSLGIPWLASLILSGLIAIPVGAILAIPAIRLTGVFLALATLGFGIFLEQMFYGESWMFGSQGIPTARPDVSIGSFSLGGDTAFYYLIIFFAVLTAAVVIAIQHGRLGRLLRALSDSPVALETYGTSINVTRVAVFCISSFLAAIAGGLNASLLHFAVGSDYASFNSISLVALLVIVTVGGPWYALIAAFALEVLPAYINLGNISEYLAILFGVSAMLSPLIARAPGAPEGIKRFADRLGGRKAALTKGEREIAPPVLTPASLEHSVAGVASRDGDRGLQIESLAVRYGGVDAVVDLTLEAPQGQVTGLIGPNGAGKTTTFNACCGLVKPSRGRIRLHGEDVSKLGPALRAQRGLGRTFQRVELFSSLTVAANLDMGIEARLAGALPWRQLRTTRSERSTIKAAVARAVDLTSIGPLLERPVAELSVGQRRLVELTRVLAGGFDLLLLDEPSSGLDQDETKHFGLILRRTIAEATIGILLVEHDMALIRQVCDQVHVLDFGRHIFQGTPRELSTSEVVRQAYLGSDDLVTESVPAESSGRQ